MSVCGAEVEHSYDLQSMIVPPKAQFIEMMHRRLVGRSAA